MKKLIIIGAGGHGKVIADIAALCGYDYIAFLDDRAAKSNMSYPIIGKPSEANRFIGADYFVAIGNAQVREKMQMDLSKKRLNTVTLIHPDAVIAKTSNIGVGTVVMAGAVINPDTKIGDGCIINTGATVDHDNVIEDYAHISVGSHLAGNVHIGKSTWIGAGAVVSNNVTVCADCMIGAGAVVIKDIVKPGTYIGVPAREAEKMNKKSMGVLLPCNTEIAFAESGCKAA